jgi:hypothetical protein
VLGRQIRSLQPNCTSSFSIAAGFSGLHERKNRHINTNLGIGSKKNADYGSVRKQGGIEWQKGRLSGGGGMGGVDDGPAHNFLRILRLLCSSGRVILLSRGIGCGLGTGGGSGGGGGEVQR